MAEARATDEEDARLGEAPASDVPEELAEPNTRLARLLAAKARLEADEAERQAAYEAKLAAREEYKRGTGNGMTGRKPMPPEERPGTGTAPRWPTPPTRTAARWERPTVGSSRAQRPGGCHEGADRRCRRGHHQLHRLRAAGADGGAGEAEPGHSGVAQRIGVVVGDAGYVTEDHLGLEEELGVELVIATRNRKRAGPGDQPRPRGRIPKGLSKTQRMDRKLRTKLGEGLYRKRGGAIEPVFGQERQRGAGHFRRRGLTACASEWRFEQTVHYLLKIRTSGKWTAPGGTPSRR